MKQHAYLIMAHKNVHQLRSLITLLDDERNDLYFLIDKKAKNLRDDDLRNGCKKSGIFFLERQMINWGGFSILEGELRLLEAALAGGVQVLSPYFRPGSAVAEPGLHPPVLRCL